MAIKDCSKCGETVFRAFTIAMMQDLGCSSNMSATQCPQGGEHDFQVVSDKKVENDNNKS